MKCRVYKNLSDKFFVVSETGEKIECVSRGKLKRYDKVVVGDIVEVEDNVIVDVMDRKNVLVRPPIANLDQLLIVVSSVPKTDFLLVDKLIVKCFANNIEPVIVVSKADILSDDFIRDVKDEYSGVVNKIVVTSSVNGQGQGELESIMKGKLSAFAGQSAVGKSKLTNLLGGDAIVGELSKIERGKNTTRHTEIFLIGDIMLADTPGFSKLDINEIKYTKLYEYYPEFKPYNEHCKYPACCHVYEKNDDCALKKALNSCKINKNRYNRYITLFEELKKYWEKMYD